MRGSQGGSPGSPEPCQGSAWVLFHQQLVCPAACPSSGTSLGGLIPLGWVTAGDSPELAPPFLSPSLLVALGFSFSFLLLAPSPAGLALGFLFPLPKALGSNEEQ